MKKRVLVLGSSNIDFVSNTERVPEAGETFLTSKDYMFVPGGKGGNTAVALARLGADCVFCARLGKDNYGRELLEFYKNEGIDARHIHLTANSSTGLANIIVDDDAKNRIIVYPGANMLISEEDVEAALITYPEALICQFEISFDRICQAVKYCNEKNIPAVIDAGPANKFLDLASLGRLEIFSPNESETEIFTGIRPNTFENCIAACIALRKMVDTKYVVLKLGDKGCFIYGENMSKFVEPYRVQAIDTTAAGDSFTAALTLEYLKNGRDILKAAKYANAVGGLVVSKSGASSSIPTEKEVASFILENEESLS